MQKSDMIYRQAAIDVIIEDKICDDSLKIMAALGEGDKAETLNMTCDRHAKMLMNLPPAQPEQPEQKTGYWINEGIECPCCSECGYRPIISENYIGVYYFSNYCPYCGAKMGAKLNE